MSGSALHRTPRFVAGAGEGGGTIDREQARTVGADGPQARAGANQVGQEHPEDLEGAVEGHGVACRGGAGGVSKPCRLSLSLSVSLGPGFRICG